MLNAKRLFETSTQLELRLLVVYNLFDALVTIRRLQLILLNKKRTKYTSSMFVEGYKKYCFWNVLRIIRIQVNKSLRTREASRKGHNGYS